MKAVIKIINSRWFIGLVAVILFGLAIFVRFYQATSFPPAPYWEEVALGYDAYSLVLTGKDHHGHPWPIAAFESFGDWKPSGYFYAAAISIKTFGLSVWATRFPAVLAGCLLVLLISLSGWLTHTFWRVGSKNFWLILLGVAVISPWAIIFSRAAWEVMLATTVFLGGLLAWWWSLESWKNHSKQIFVAFLLSLSLAVASMYTYHALRLIAPLMYLWTLVWWLAQQSKVEMHSSLVKQKTLTFILSLFSVIFLIGLLMPILQNLRSPVIQQRFAETSILNSSEPVEKSNAARAAAGNTIFAKLLYHRYWFETQLVTQQFLKHLDLNFLFIHGDTNPRHSSQYFGQLYYLDAVFIILGAVFLWRNQRQWAIYLLGWWFIATLPAALTTAAPHALRSLATLPVWLWLISYGIAVSVKKLSWLWPVIIGGYIFSFCWFWAAYSQQYSKTFAAEWQAGYCEMYQALSNAMEQNPTLPVYVTRVQGRPAMYYWFCQQIDPVRVQAAELVTKKDQAEFLSFENLTFVNGVAEVPAGPALVAAEIHEAEPNQKPLSLYSSSSWQIWRQ